MKIAVIAMIALLGLTGCASQKNWGSMGGSKADGTVKMAYTYGMFEIPKVDAAQAQREAAKRCQAWGFISAQAFDFTDTRCQQMTQSGCAKTIVTQEFQCE